MTDEEQLIKVFELLGNEIDPETGKTYSTNPLDILIRVIIFFKQEFISFLKKAGFWEQRAFWFAIGSTAAYFSFALIILVFKIKLQSWAKAVISLLFIFIIMLSLLSFMVLNVARMQNRSKGFIRKKNQLIGKNNLDEQIEEQRIVNQLGNIASLQNLKEAELRFNSFIEQSQGRDQSASNFLPILALISIILYVYISGLSLQPLEDLLSGGVKGAPGVFAIILYISKFTFESESQTRILKYKKYLYFLKQAQLKKNNTNP